MAGSSARIQQGNPAISGSEIWQGEPVLGSSPWSGGLGGFSSCLIDLLRVPDFRAQVVGKQGTGTGQYTGQTVAPHQAVKVDGHIIVVQVTSQEALALLQ